MVHAIINGGYLTAIVVVKKNVFFFRAIHSKYFVSTCFSYANVKRGDQQKKKKPLQFFFIIVANNYVDPKTETKKKKKFKKIILSSGVKLIFISCLTHHHNHHPKYKQKRFVSYDQL